MQICAKDQGSHFAINHGVVSGLGEQVLPKESSSSKTKISSSKLRTFGSQFPGHSEGESIKSGFYGMAVTK